MADIEACGMVFALNDNGQGFAFDLKCMDKGGIKRLSVGMDFYGKKQPKKVCLSWSLPAIRPDGVWSCCGGMNRRLTPDWEPYTVSARSASEYPVLSVLSFDDVNICTVSSMDAETPINLKAGYKEEKSELVFSVEWFVNVTEKADGYKTELLIDTRPIHFAKCVSTAEKELSERYGLQAAPKSAFMPVFSTWYCFHQELYREKLLAECKKAKELGLETVIIDDGWQSDDNNRGYGFSGDYIPAIKKVGDIKSLTEEIKKIGLKSMLWFSLAFSGDFTAGAEKFRNMTLYREDGLNASVVDPRFAEIRKHIVAYCVKAVGEWGFDGLKLDFIDSFKLTEENAVKDGIDCSSLEEGIRRLTDELSCALKAEKNDVLIEFRQRYIGPAMQRLGNMLRVGDCPGALLQNRISAIDLRLISGARAVHCDPLEWNVGESPEYIAKAFINTIFSVLQFSVYPSDLTKDRRKVVERYIRFVKEYEDVLLHGELTPKGALNNYISCSAENNGVEIIALYSQTVIKITKSKTIVLNASESDKIVVDCDDERVYSVEDCFGQLVSSGKISGLKYIAVPVGGMLIL